VDARTAFSILAESYFFTRRQRQAGSWGELGPLRTVRYDYVWQGRRRIADHLFAFGATPDVTLEAVRAYDPVVKHQLFVTGDGLEAYLAAGWRVKAEQYLMGRAPAVLAEPAYTVERAVQPSDAFMLNRIGGGGGVTIEDLIDPGLQFYYISEGNLPRAQARTGAVRDDVCWVSDVFTAPSHRRRGMARALMVHILAENARTGAPYNLLLASEAGFELYRSLDYDLITPVVRLKLGR
jgi:GNAT superfamily N-acetyltransferase